MPDLNDFHAFKSTSSGNGSGSGIHSGCLSPLVIIGLIVALLMLLGKCSS